MFENDTICIELDKNTVRTFLETTELNNFKLSPHPLPRFQSLLVIQLRRICKQKYLGILRILFPLRLPHKKQRTKFKYSWVIQLELRILFLKKKRGIGWFLSL